MRAMFLRVFPFAAPLMLVAAAAAPLDAQTIAPGMMAVQPIIPTEIEMLLATPNAVIVTDYYWIDTRFGPNLRIDAVIVDAPDLQRRLKGLRVQVHDKESRGRQEGTSFMDLDELRKLSRALSAMSELAARWAGPDDRRANEIAFTSAGGFRIAIRQSARLPRAYISTGLLDPVVTSIELIELSTLKQAFDQALGILQSK
jgi:hypothetical protein